MSNILKVSVPTGGLENNTRTNPITVNDANIQNIVDPSKVVKPDGQRTNSDRNMGANYESNFQSFVSALRNKPELVETLKSIYFQMGSMVSSGIGEDFAAEIAKFLEMTKMTPEDAVKFLQEQGSQNNKFSSDLFQALKLVLNNTKSVELKTSILSFLKAYNDVSASGNTLKNIVSVLKSMSKYMPQSYRQGLLDAAANLEKNSTLGAAEKNITVLKREILPFLSAYTHRTHDMGKVRDFITLLTLNTARYENGTMEKLLSEFQKMSSFQDFKKVFGDDLQAVFESFLQELTTEKSSSFADKLLANMQRGLNGEGGYEMKTVFQNIMGSFLLNESVYMPLQHFVFPVELFGRQMFSEMWVDPDCGQRNGADSDGEKMRKLLIKFDIKEVGFFDLILLHQGNKLDIQLRYPEKYQLMEKDIKKGITELVNRNGMVCQKLFLTKSTVPVTISEVFPQIYERKNAINVKI